MATSASRIPRASGAGVWEIGITFILRAGMHRNIGCAAMLRHAGICGLEHDGPYPYRGSAFRTLCADERLQAVCCPVEDGRPQPNAVRFVEGDTDPIAGQIKLEIKWQPHVALCP